MAAYTELTEDLLEELADDYGFGRITGASPIPQGSVNTNYLLETPKGKYLLRIDEAKGEMEVKREIDLLSFLHKHSFPCPHPLQDRKGRYYRQYRGRCLSISKYAEGRMIAPQGLRPGSLKSWAKRWPNCMLSARATKRASTTASVSSGSPPLQQRAQPTASLSGVDPTLETRSTI